jgi:hypothetical protein
MFEKRLLENVKEGEEALAVVRRTPLVILLPAVTSAIFIIAPFFFLYPLLRHGITGSLIFVVSLLFGIILGFRSLWVHQLNAFILTNERIIDVDQRGIFHKVVSEATFDKVQDVSYIVKGIFATIFQFGSVMVQTAGASANLELTGVRHPQRVQELIVKLQRESVKPETEDSLSADDLLAMIKKIKAGVGEEQFRRLIAHRPSKRDQE